MKRILKLLIIVVLPSCSTYKPPNSDLCVKDGPSHLHCAWTVQGNDFEIDNQYHHYTLHGQDLNADQFDKYALRMSPWTYADQKNNFLNYCHSHKNACNYALALKTFSEIESRLGIDRITESLPERIEKEDTDRN